MDTFLKVLMIDAGTGFYRMERYPVGDFFGPVDLGLHMAGKFNSLNIGAGLLAGSIFPGSNRLVFTGFSPCWGSFYVSSMGGAGLVFDNVGVNMVSIIGRASTPSVLSINRSRGEEVQVQIEPLDLPRVWKDGRGGMYSVMSHAFERFGGEYDTDPRVLAVGPASSATDFGAIASAPINNGKISYVDTWAGRGGLGTKMLVEHGLAGVIYGGTFIEEDFRDRKVADEWFQDKYQKKLVAKDFEATTKYRFDPRFDTGGTFGVNYATLAGRIMALNYRSIYMDESQRLDIHEKFIVNHYLKQFNEETIKTKSYRHCGEPCTAVCKKMHGEYKKDYEPYQTMGPLCGIFDQRAAEKINHKADELGYDAISVGGVLSWLMECLVEGLIEPREVGAKERPNWDMDSFSNETDSAHNADIGVDMLTAMVEGRTILSMKDGARKNAWRLAKSRSPEILNKFVYNANARKGWMVPNQYWTPGVLSPMAIMGKYYMYYGSGFLPPRELGRKNAERMIKEMAIDNLGICRFHRAWAEDMIPEIIDKVFGMKDQYLENAAITAGRINSRNAAVFWESERNADYVYSFLKRRHEVEEDKDPELMRWLDAFKKNRMEAALDFWFEISKGVHESLREL